jgi:hypothetical protein
VKKTPSVKSARKTKVSSEERKAVATNSKTRCDSDSVVLDRRSARDRRKGEDRRRAEVAVAVERRQLERRQKVSRRRQIDPTTCERNYSDEEIEFMTALDGYKRKSGRMFPTCSEILEVLRDLGYEKRSPIAPPVSMPSPETPPPATTPLLPTTEPAILTQIVPAPVWQPVP